MDFLVAACYGQNAVTAGKFHVDPPTLENLGFAWSITGDANRNAQVKVEYKAAGESSWRPLFRCCESAASR